MCSILEILGMCAGRKSAIWRSQWLRLGSFLSVDTLLPLVHKMYVFSILQSNLTYFSLKDLISLPFFEC